MKAPMNELKYLQQQLATQRARHKSELASLRAQVDEFRANTNDIEPVRQQIEEYSGMIKGQLEKIGELQGLEGRQLEMIEKQQVRWKLLMGKLEADYRAKVEEFQDILQLSEAKAAEFDAKQRKPAATNVKLNEQAQRQRAVINDLKGKLQQSQKYHFQINPRVAQDKLNLQAEICMKKEADLQLWVTKEEEQKLEIQKKEDMIRNFKDLLDHQNQEKELIVEENSKIRVQLQQIKDLFKEKLPQLGIDPNLFDLDEEEEEEEEGKQFIDPLGLPIEEEKQDEDNSTEVEDNQGQD